MKRSRMTGRSNCDGLRVGKYLEFNKNVDTGTAKARVATARNRPWMRRAGMPTRTAAAAPTRVAARTASRKSAPACTSRLALTAAPRPTNANWPRLICPAHPVRTTRETAMIPYRAT